jgi:hypothetical protein
MFGDDLDLGSLELWWDTELVFRRRYSLGDEWYTGKAALSNCVGRPVFKAYKGGSSNDMVDIAIDEVWIVPGVCSGEQTGNYTSTTHQHNTRSVTKVI